MKRFLVAALALAALGAHGVPAGAADGMEGATVRGDGARSAADRKARYEQWCKDNPEKCREAQARREQCRADPEKCKAEIKAQAEQRFKKADANRDGRLTREEAQKGMPAVARRFDAVDADRDGVVTMEELLAPRKAR